MRNENHLFLFTTFWVSDDLIVYSTVEKQNDFYLDANTGGKATISYGLGLIFSFISLLSMIVFSILKITRYYTFNSDNIQSRLL